MNYFPDGEHRRQLLAALRASEPGVEELWLRHFALGGEVGKMEIEAYLDGLLPLSRVQHDLISRVQHDLIAHAINERLDGVAPPRAPYAAELPASLPKWTTATTIPANHEERGRIPTAEVMTPARRTTCGAPKPCHPSRGKWATGFGIARVAYL
ncbi:hypothetical protein [Rhodococcus pyridinivorans]|uniref:hypothetical protein n=2 Tax=Rhodococcus pyridinivorans TaxID=103816 RepID=UPI00211F2253|nr:hypothetical protein [Rhodococcus pyridinivorans]